MPLLFRAMWSVDFKKKLQIEQPTVFVYSLNTCIHTFTQTQTHTMAHLQLVKKCGAARLLLQIIKFQIASVASLLSFFLCCFLPRIRSVVSRTMHYETYDIWRIIYRLNDPYCGTHNAI